MSEHILEPDQKQRLLREAHALRGAVLRTLFGRLQGSSSAAVAAAWAGVRACANWITAIARDGWHNYARRRGYRAAVRELGSLDDRSLKDLGLHRSEIESVVYGTHARREGKVVSFLFHKPFPKPSAGKPEPCPHPIERNAA